jgi:hypothetical protein
MLQYSIVQNRTEQCLSLESILVLYCKVECDT